jgi:hypothetical protein
VGRREPDPVRSEQIVDLAIDDLLAEIASGNTPRRLKGWLRCVLERIRRSDRRLRRRPAVELRFEPPARESASARAEQLLERRRTWLLTNLPRIARLLTPRQLRILRSTVHGQSIRAMAKDLHEDPSGIRKAQAAIAQRIRRGILAELLPPPPTRRLGEPHPGDRRSTQRSANVA